jgi:protein disulfide-isomerase
MKKLVLLIAVGIACAAPAAEKPAAGDATWTTDYQAALAAAKKSGHPILADFTGSDWCGWCKKLKAEVFDTAEFKTWAAAHVVLLEVDFPRAKAQSDAEKKQNQQLQQKFGIQGYPTIVFIDDKGAQVGQTGYVEGGPKAWIASAEQAVKGGAKK